MKQINNRLERLPKRFGDYSITKNNGVYSLYRRGLFVMDSSASSIHIRKRICKEAHGDVVVGGLGLGYGIVLLRKNKKVRNIVCVEIDPVLVDVVAPIYPEVPIICQDIFTYLASAGSFDTLLLVL